MVVEESTLLLYTGTKRNEKLERQSATVVHVPSGVTDVEITLQTDKAAQFALLDALYPGICIFGTA